MSPLRRRPPVDPRAAARLAALRPEPVTGWVPPAARPVVAGDAPPPPQQVGPAAADDQPQLDGASAGAGAPRVAARHRGRHAARPSATPPLLPPSPALPSSPSLPLSPPPDDEELEAVRRWLRSLSGARTAEGEEPSEPRREAAAARDGLTEPYPASELPAAIGGSSAAVDLGRDVAAPSPLDRWRGARLDPGRRGVAALALLALVAACLAGTVVLRARPEPVTPPPVAAIGVPVPGSATPSVEPAATEVVVAVAGKVPRPGLVRLPAGSRVADAVAAAGGAAPDADLTALNLARRLADGEQVLVGVPAPPGAPAGPVGGVPVADAPLDLNTATLQQFDALPGIGPVLAQKIVDWRTEHGRFGSVDQLREVSGIGEAKYAELEPKVRV